MVHFQNGIIILTEIISLNNSHRKVEIRHSIIKCSHGYLNIPDYLLLIFNIYLFNDCDNLEIIRLSEQFQSQCLCFFPMCHAVSIIFICCSYNERHSKSLIILILLPPFRSRFELFLFRFIFIRSSPPGTTLYGGHRKNCKSTPDKKLETSATARRRCWVFETN